MSCMNTDKDIIAWSVALGVWVVMAISMDSTRKDAIHHNQEAINTAEDMIEWINHDLESGKVDSSVAMMYVDNLEGLIIELRAR